MGISVPRVDLQCGSGWEKKIKHDIVDVCKLHQPQQSLFEDNYPLPEIDKLIDTTIGHGMLNFIDAFSIYHQIPLYIED